MSNSLKEFQTLQDELDYLGAKAFSLIELVEVSGVKGSAFEVLRKKLLNLGNDIRRIGEKSYPKG